MGVMTSIGCRFCHEPIHVDATVCPHCNRDQVGKTAGTVRVADRSARLGIAVIMFLQLIGIIVFAAH